MEKLRIERPSVGLMVYKQAACPVGAIQSVLNFVSHWFMSRPRGTRMLLAGAMGIVFGVALLAFRASNAVSYLSDEPTTCINCHVMVPYYAGWERSAHREVATCNDCHVPHENKLKSLFFKGQDGLRHATVFTMRWEPQTLKLNPAAIPVIQSNCIRCHEHQIMRVDMGEEESERLCWECHRETPHGLAQSLSSSPHVLRPILPSAGIPRAPTRPAWSTAGRR